MTTPPPDNRRLRVLIVDDHTDTAESLAELVRLWDYVPRTVTSGAAALEAFDQFRPTVALLDLSLPDQNGYDVAQQLQERARRRRLFIVVVTGTVAIPDQERSTVAGISHHLVKPINIDALKRILASYQFAHEVREASYDGPPERPSH